MKEVVREMTLENGGKVYFKAGPVYPYWRINFDSGNTPKQLSGMYQYYDDAVEAVKNYVETRPARNRTTVTDDVKETVQVPRRK